MKVLISDVAVTSLGLTVIATATRDLELFFEHRIDSLQTLRFAD